MLQRKWKKKIQNFKLEYDFNAHQLEKKLLKINKKKCMVYVCTNINIFHVLVVVDVLKNY